MYESKSFDGSALGGKQLVTFEELYDMTNPEEPKKVTEHKDINDEGQTVTIKKVPETPIPETPGTTTKTSNPPTPIADNAAMANHNPAFAVSPVFGAKDFDSYHSN